MKAYSMLNQVNYLILASYGASGEGNYLNISMKHQALLWGKWVEGNHSVLGTERGVFLQFCFSARQEKQQGSDKKCNNMFLFLRREAEMALAHSFLHFSDLYILQWQQELVCDLHLDIWKSISGSTQCWNWEIISI